jgi:hypothetical protein
MGLMDRVRSNPLDLRLVRLLVRDSAWAFSDRAAVDSSISSLANNVGGEANPNWVNFCAGKRVGFGGQEEAPVLDFLVALAAVSSDAAMTAKIIRLVAAAGWNPFTSAARLRSVLDWEVEGPAGNALSELLSQGSGHGGDGMQLVVDKFIASGGTNMVLGDFLAKVPLPPSAKAKIGAVVGTELVRAIRASEELEQKWGSVGVVSRLLGSAGSDATGEKATKSSLVSLKRDSVATEFSETTELRQRLKVKEVSVSVLDARNKVPSVITIFTCPDNVSAAAADPFAFEKVGEIKMAKGATSGSVKLPAGCIASLVKVAFSAFHPCRDGAANMCPRCSRAVTNSAGVCGGCGEVITQCRRCRAIR